MNNNEILLLKLGEVVLKGLNRRSFEDKLVSNVRRRMKPCGSFQIYIRQSTIYVEPQTEDCDMEAAFKAARQVFGIVTVARAVPCAKEMDAIVETAKTYLADEFAKARTFKVESRRADKQFPMNSIQISQYVGGELGQFFNVKADMHHPDLTVYVEIREKYAYIHTPSVPGAGGLPIGMGGRAVSLLSGGLDSSLVCAISAKLLKKPIRTFAIGMRADAIDLKYAREVAEYLHADHTEVIITPEDVIQALPEVVALLGTYDITTIRASIGMYLVCKAIHEQTDLRVLLTGEISDELFGYKYTDFAPSPAAFQEESAKRIRELHMYDVLRADRCISVNSLEARVPFGDLDFVQYVMSIDPAKKCNVYGKGKYLLRHAFEGDWLPHDILMREKAAFSDAVGHSMVDDLKAYAEQKYTDEEFETLRRKYDFAQPFTKESLLYRELFEQYYPGQAHMIVDFWMPNKSWAGCDVDDPSARVLANYGDSGK